jgi:hypothetical protein
VGRAPSPQFRNISPVLEGDADFDHLPEGMRNMGRENIYRIHDPEGRQPDFIVSHVAPTKMNQMEAIDYCKGLGGGARLPTKEELETLGRAMGQYQHGGYQINLIPQMNLQFWSSSLLIFGFGSYYFHGQSGHTQVAMSDLPKSVRCVR